MQVDLIDDAPKRHRTIVKALIALDRYNGRALAILNEARTSGTAPDPIQLERLAAGISYASGIVSGQIGWFDPSPTRPTPAELAEIEAEAIRDYDLDGTAR